MNVHSFQPTRNMGKFELMDTSEIIVDNNTSCLTHEVCPSEYSTSK